MGHGPWISLALGQWVLRRSFPVLLPLSLLDILGRSRVISQLLAGWWCLELVVFSMVS